jgi:hypothetical protein
MPIQSWLRNTFFQVSIQLEFSVQYLCSFFGSSLLIVRQSHCWKPSVRIDFVLSSGQWNCCILVCFLVFTVLEFHVYHRFSLAILVQTLSLFQHHNPCLTRWSLMACSTSRCSFFTKVAHCSLPHTLSYSSITFSINKKAKTSTPRKRVSDCLTWKH